ncbi:MAG: glycosyltransferase [Anaerolineales bacterium]|jgi:glycosyltransferase involved in cell wall biosynthesis
MNKLGIFVGEEKWTFFNEIFTSLDNHYQCEVFKLKTINTPFFYDRLNRWAVRSGILKILKRNDTCFFEWASDYLSVASYLPKNCQIITRLHSFEIYQWAPRINWENVDKIILVSESMRRTFIELYPDQSSKTKVIYNGRSLDKFKPPPERNFQFKVGMLCSITPIKRIYEVVLMMYDLRKQGFDFKLYIGGEPFGDFRYAKALYRLVGRLDLQDSVFFEGFVTDTAAWLRDIDVFISNSYWEGQQVALIEAIASGCYCISHHWPGADEMLPEENLFFTESQLKEKLIKFATLGVEEKYCKSVEMREIATRKFDVRRTNQEIRSVIDEEFAKLQLAE